MRFATARRTRDPFAGFVGKHHERAARLSGKCGRPFSIAADGDVWRWRKRGWRRQPCRDGADRLRSRRPIAARSRRRVLSRRPRRPISETAAAYARHHVRRRRPCKHVPLQGRPCGFSKPLGAHAALESAARGAAFAVRNVPQPVHRRSVGQGAKSRHRKHAGVFPPRQAHGIQGRQSARRARPADARDNG